MISKILSPSTKAFLINSGVITGLSLTSLAGVAMMHFETDRSARQQAFELQSGCLAQDQHGMFDCESSRDFDVDDMDQVSVASLGAGLGAAPGAVHSTHSIVNPDSASSRPKTRGFDDAQF